MLTSLICINLSSLFFGILASWFNITAWTLFGVSSILLLLYTAKMVIV
jgi:hypothetical protein